MNVDLSVLRDFRFTEKVRMHVRGESFNAFNHTNLAIPGRTLNGPGFGLISECARDSSGRTRRSNGKRAGPKIKIAESGVVTRDDLARFRDLRCRVGGEKETCCSFPAGVLIN